LFISSRSSFVKKKAGLCLLRIYRKFPELLPINDWAHDIVNMMDDENLGVVNSAVCLITALAQAYPDLTSGCVVKAIMRLNSVSPDTIAGY
jgi:AP-2 complex subunit alpha